jgi:secretion/DNA translocation related TadE-like protein
VSAARSRRSPSPPCGARAGCAGHRLGGWWAGDDGYATVWAVGVIAVVLVVMLVGLNLGMAISGRHRAEAAADLAALAAASHATDGEPAACAYAARIAEGMATRLVECRLSGWEARVELEAGTRLFVGAGGAAFGRARAGPVGG